MQSISSGWRLQAHHKRPSNMILILRIQMMITCSMLEIFQDSSSLEIVRGIRISNDGSGRNSTNSSWEAKVQTLSMPPSNYACKNMSVPAHHTASLRPVHYPNTNTSRQWSLLRLTSTTPTPNVSHALEKILLRPRQEARYGSRTL